MFGEGGGGGFGEREFVGLGFELFFFCARKDVEVDDLVFEDFNHADDLNFKRYLACRCAASTTKPPM